MGKKKTLHREDAKEKQELKEEAAAAEDTATTETAVDAAGTTDAATAPRKKRKKRKRAARCPLSKGARGWVLLLLIVAAVVFGYKYLAQSGGTLKGLFGGAKQSVDANDPQQWGYAVGALVGKQVVGMLDRAPGKDELDMDMVVRGLTEAVRKAKKPLYSDEQVQKLLEQRMQIEKERQVQEARANKEKSEAFVAEYAKKDGVKKLDGGTLYKVEHSGDGALVGEKAAKIHYTGKHMDGEEFDSSRDGEPIVLSAKNVVPGFGAALRAMHVGDKWEIVIPADQAYGEQGMPPAGIKPNEALIFEIEVVALDK